MYENYMGKEHMAEETKKMSKEDKKAYGDYDMKMRAEYDVKVLAEAVEIQGDAKRLKYAVHCAKMQRSDLDKVIA